MTIFGSEHLGKQEIHIGIVSVLCIHDTIVMVLKRSQEECIRERIIVSLKFLSDLVDVLYP
jgi:hypothetical protein